MTKALIFDFFGVLLTDDGKNTELIELVRDFKQRDYKLAILSNLLSSEPIEAVLSVDELALFDVVALSYQLGYEKPNPRAYLSVASQLGKVPADCVFIDDSVDNCRGATAAGMQAIRYLDLASLKLSIKQLLT